MKHGVNELLIFTIGVLILCSGCAKENTQVINPGQPEVICVMDRTKHIFTLTCSNGQIFTYNLKEK